MHEMDEDDDDIRSCIVKGRLKQMTKEGRITEVWTGIAMSIDEVGTVEGDEWDLGREIWDDMSGERLNPERVATARGEERE